MYNSRKDIKYSKGKEFDGIKIILGITGSVASIESPHIARELIRHGAEVIPVMSKSAMKFITPEIMNWATGNTPIVKMTGELEHIQLTDFTSGADLFLIAPCTANTIGKISQGICDNIITTIATVGLGSGMPLFIAPSMHKPMLSNQIIKSNLDKLKSLGVKIINPVLEENKAKISNPEEICSSIIGELFNQDLRNLNVVVTAGTTVEKIDSVRQITNSSSGKMGLELAQEAARRGANVDLVIGPNNLDIPHNINSIHIETTKEMLTECVNLSKQKKVDLFIAAAAPADYYLSKPYNEKIKSRINQDLEIRLSLNPKIIEVMRELEPTMDIIAFKAIDDSYDINSYEFESIRNKVKPKLLIVNNITKKEIGFGSDLNQVEIITKHNEIVKTPIIKKSLLSRQIFDILIDLNEKRNKNYL